MPEDERRIKIEEILPFAKSFNEKHREQLYQYSLEKNVEPESFIYREGDRCGFLPIVLEGRMRIFKSTIYGREITLYRIHPGEACILSGCAILNHETFPALAIAEEPLRAVQIPALVFVEWMRGCEVFQQYYWHLAYNQMLRIIATAEQAAFGRMDARIASYLLHAPGISYKRVRLTHQKIANDLGTAREVVSRILEQFEKKNILSLSRGAITVQNVDFLKKIAQSD